MSFALGGALATVVPVRAGLHFGLGLQFGCVRRLEIAHSNSGKTLLRPHVPIARAWPLLGLLHKCTRRRRNVILIGTGQDLVCKLDRNIARPRFRRVERYDATWTPVFTVEQIG